MVDEKLTVHICRPKSEDAVIEYYIEKKRLDADPYWAALWPSARVLSAHLAHMHFDDEEEATEHSHGGFSIRGKTVCRTRLRTWFSRHNASKVRSKVGDIV